jgi:hypothetical protein
MRTRTRTASCTTTTPMTTEKRPARLTSLITHQEHCRRRFAPSDHTSTLTHTSEAKRKWLGALSCESRSGQTVVSVLGSQSGTVHDEILSVVEPRSPCYANACRSDRQLPCT